MLFSANKPFSMHLDPDAFRPATEAEKEYISKMRPSSTFFRDGCKRLLRNKVATMSLIVIILVTIGSLVLPLVWPYSYDAMLGVRPGKPADSSFNNLKPFEWGKTEQRRIEEEQAKKAEEEKAKASYTSIADNAKTRKSAFFKRAPVSRDTDNSAQEEHTSAYGGIVRPSAIVDEERDIKKNMTAPAMGAALEGQRPSIMDPNSKAAPTASKPLAGFKGSDNTVNREDDSSEDK